jgi:hypothetical protein
MNDSDSKIKRHRWTTVSQALFHALLAMDMGYIASNERWGKAIWKKREHRAACQSGRTVRRGKPAQKQLIRPQTNFTLP